MVHMKTRKNTDDELRASVMKEMAKPRMPRSAKIAELKLDSSRIPEPPSTSVPGTVDRIFPSPGLSQPERAQIGMDLPDKGFRDIRIENSLTDEFGDDVRLKKGAKVEVTVTRSKE